MFRRNPLEFPSPRLPVPRRQVRAGLYALLALSAGAGTALALDDSPGPAPAPKPRRIETDGAVLEFTPQELAKGRRSAKSELKALLEATATLSLQRDLRQRSLRLPAGAYTIRLEEENAESCWLIIGEPPAPEGPKAKSARGRRSPPMGLAGRCLEELQRGSAGDNPPAPAPETKKGSGNEAKKGERPAEGKVPAPNGKDDEEDDDEAGKPNGSEERQVGGLRVKLRIQRPEGGAASEEIGFSLKSLEKGKRLEISAQAGHTIARGALRFAAPAK